MSALISFGLRVKIAVYLPQKEQSKEDLLFMIDALSYEEDVLRYLEIKVVLRGDSFCFCGRMKVREASFRKHICIVAGAASGRAPLYYAEFFRSCPDRISKVE